jgi:hypothetical protein
MNVVFINFQTYMAYYMHHTIINEYINFYGKNLQMLGIVCPHQARIYAGARGGAAPSGEFRAPSGKMTRIQKFQGKSEF